LYSEVVQDLPNYSIQHGRHGELRTYELVNNHRFRNFEETWRNSEIDQKVEQVIEEFRPDVVHIQHLLNFSFGVVDLLNRRNIPIVMTLHDHWLQCANGGQRFHSSLGRCEVLDAARCGSCTAHLNGAGLGARGFLLRKRAASRRHGSELALVQAEPVSVETPDARFVYRDRYFLDGVLRPTWVAHPPTRIVFDVRLERGGWFLVDCGLHPDTFDRPGPGVFFRVRVDGDLKQEHLLDPKRSPEDRTPVHLRFELRPGRRQLELETQATSDDTQFCTAGWIDPRIRVPQGSLGSFEPRWQKAASYLMRPFLRVAARSQSARIQRRWDAVADLVSRVDAFVAPSPYLAREFVEFGIPKQKMRISDYGFDLRAFRKRKDLPERMRKFGFIGSLVPHKGVHQLIHAFSDMPGDARLEIYGSPDYAPSYFESLRARAIHPGIRFCGALLPSQVPTVLKTIDALVVPSIWYENSPLTIHEAFLTGVPVVASRLGGHEDLLRDGGGLLYEPDDAVNLSTALRRLYEEPELGRLLAASAPPVKSVAEDAQELIALYRSVLAGRGDGGGRS